MCSVLSLSELYVSRLSADALADVLADGLVGSDALPFPMKAHACELL